MNKIIQDKLDSVRNLCKLNRVKSMHTFGSVNTVHFTEQSDIDLLIEFNPTIGIEEYTDCYFALHDSLTRLFRRKIDLVTMRSLNNPFFIQHVEQTKQLIYAES